VTAITRLRLPDGATALVQRATTHEEAPAHDADAAFVRAEILHGLFLVQPAAAQQNRTHFTMVGHYNPGGGVPAWVMNQLAARNPASFIDALSRVAQQFDTVAAQHIGKKGNTLAACADRSFDSEPCPWLVNMDMTALHSGSSSSSIGSATFADVETAARGLCKESNNCSVLLGVLTVLIAVCIAAAGSRRRRRKRRSAAATAQHHAHSNGSVHHACSNGHSTAVMNGSSTGDAASSSSSSSRNSSATSPSANQRRIVELYRSLSATPPLPPVTAVAAAAAAAQDTVQLDAAAAELDATE
jgi:START domain